MSDVVLKVLGVLGIVLLILLGVLTALLIFILFFPVTYKATGKKDAEGLVVKVKLNWLFGILRGYYGYPSPGKFVLRLLWIPLFDSSSPAKAGGTDSGKEPEGQSSAEPEASASQQEGADPSQQGGKSSEAELLEEILDEVLPETEQAKRGIKAFLISKYRKIKYTILKIYDKIKHICENIHFYKELLQDEQTIGLLNHARERLLKILKSIRPRKLKAVFILGTGEPDTTGYLLAVYGILSPMLGNRVSVTPGFTQAVFQGDFYMAGYITVFQLLYHSLRVLLDRRLALLNTRIKQHKNQQNEQAR